MISSEEKIRYSRQISIPGIGEAGQERLLRSRVLVIGCGALGSMIAMQLAGAGIGELTIADFDTIDLSNLQRQFFFTVEDARKMKAEVLAERIRFLNPGCKLTVIKKMVTQDFADSIAESYDVIVDGTDNPASKSMIEDVSRRHGIACCLGGVSQFRGQVMMIPPGGTGFSEVFSAGSEAGFMPCSIGGVIGAAASVCASIQVSEIIKYLLQMPCDSDSCLVTFDLRDNRLQSYKF